MSAPRTHESDSDGDDRRNDPARSSGTFFERLAEPFLVVDRELSVVAVNAAWRALFAGGTDSAADPVQASADPQQHRHLIRTLAASARIGSDQQSAVICLKVRSGSASDDRSQPRYWQVHASMLAPLADEPALIALRYDDVTARGQADESPRLEEARQPAYDQSQRIRPDEAAGQTHDRIRQIDQAVTRAGLGTWEINDTSTRTMDQFVAAVSHELRSPLNAIVSWAELLKVAGPSHVDRAGDAIRRNGRQLAHMVDDLLDSGAIATGKLSVNLQPVDLGALAAIIAEDMRKAMEDKRIELRLSDIAPCIVMADESRMKQVLWNLLSNALKFTDAGSVDISVSHTDKVASLIVRDTGRGIPAAALPLVFDRFQQISPKSSGRSGGLGLGLWLVKHIVTLHGGTVSAESEDEGRGSTFTVTLPLRVDARR
jgi:signal transduction histidine kinase